jgi:hypothetical protein
VYSSGLHLGYRWELGLHYRTNNLQNQGYLNLDHQVLKIQQIQNTHYCKCKPHPQMLYLVELWHTKSYRLHNLLEVRWRLLDFESKLELVLPWVCWLVFLSELECWWESVKVLKLPLVFELDKVQILHKPCSLLLN